MTKEEIKKLIERYPYLQPRNVWTDKVSDDYDYTYIRGIGEIPKGWEKLFLQMCEDIRQPLIDANSLEDFRFTQIKEKYNTLRAYNNGAPKVVHEIINKYSAMSSYVCTCCGKPATYETQGWIESFCDDCCKEFVKKEYAEKIEFKPYYKVEGFENGEHYEKTISFEDEWNRYLDSIKENIIFLDIDGVLNGYNKWNLLGWKLVGLTKSKKLKHWYANLTDPCGVHESKVKRLAKIVKETNAKVVMSSSWRFGWWNKPYDEQHTDQKKLTDLLNKYNIEVIDITPRSLDGRRDKEIEEWLTKHEGMVKRFVILDDERSDLECFVGSHLVQTSSISKGQIIMGCAKENTGLKNKHVKQAIEILTK